MPTADVLHKIDSGNMFAKTLLNLFTYSQLFMYDGLRYVVAATDDIPWCKLHSPRIYTIELNSPDALSSCVHTPDIASVGFSENLLSGRF